MKTYRAKPNTTLKAQIMQRIEQATSNAVWTPADFLDLGPRDAIDKTLQRVVSNGELRRIDRGLYDRPAMNALTQQLTSADYQSVIQAVSRRNQVRVLIDGMTAANNLGLTHAVPGQITVHTDGRIQSIQLGNLTIQFKLTAPSKLYWAGRPAMYIVQALYWLHDALKSDKQITQKIKTKLVRLLQDPNQGQEICDDLRIGLHTLPLWMRQWIQELLQASTE